MLECLECWNAGMQADLPSRNTDQPSEDEAAELSRASTRAQAEASVRAAPRAKEAGVTRQANDDTQ